MELPPSRRKSRKSFNIPGEAHELTFSCFKRRKFLGKERTRAYFLEALELAREKHGIHLWAYVIMPEHAHVLIWPEREEYSVGGILKTIKQSVSRKAIGYLREENPAGLKLLATGHKESPYRFWMDGGGYDRNVHSFGTLRKMVDYIHNNPVRRGLVEHAEDWKWSSLAEWLEEGSGPIRIDRDSWPGT